MKYKLRICVTLLLLVGILNACTNQDDTTTSTIYKVTTTDTTISDILTESVSELELEIPSVSTFDNEPYVEINNNVPYFDDDEKSTTTSFETYSDLDDLGRCGVAYACIGKDIMPTEERGEIGSVKPSGWHTVKYPDVISDLYLYNRCHLIAYCLTGENANEKNLITGTRYLNITGMLPFETSVAQYMDNNPDNHVLYRVTPIFEDDNLVADGVLMEGYSVEDNGAGIQFCVFCYNVQPNIQIDYKTGDSAELTVKQTDTTETSETDIDNTSNAKEYVLNSKSKKIHMPDCSALSNMSDGNRIDTLSNYDDLISNGYEPCGICHPESNQEE